MSTEDQIRKQMDEARESRIKEVASEFDQAQVEYAGIGLERPQLDEYRFVNVFLPFFAGDKELLYNVNLINWVNVAGSPFQEVDIVDAKGAFLFTVPPIADRTAHVAFRGERGESSILNIVESAKNIANVHPAQSLHFLRTELANRAATMRESGHALEHVKRWNAIFARYNRPLIEVEGVNLTDGTQPKEEKVEFDGFDEL